MLSTDRCHIILSLVKNSPPCDAAFRQNSLTTRYYIDDGDDNKRLAGHTKREKRQKGVEKERKNRKRSLVRVRGTIRVTVRARVTHFRFMV